MKYTEIIQNIAERPYFKKRITEQTMTTIATYMKKMKIKDIEQFFKEHADLDNDGRLSFDELI